MRPMQVGSGKRGPSFDEGSLDQYLREISRYPLIPQEEEVQLAQRIRLGEAEALDKLVRSNLPRGFRSAGNSLKSASYSRCSKNPWRALFTRSMGKWGTRATLGGVAR